jgi:hypothetical protein
MSLRTPLEAELQRLHGLSVAVPVGVRVANGAGIELTVEFLAVDSLACEFTELAVSTSVLNSTTFDALKAWAQRLCGRITYLLEHIAPLEFDEPTGQVLIRSTAPDQLPDGTQYYEMLLHSQGGSGVALRRYRSVKGQPGRQQIPMTTTREVLLKLADDLVATMPSGTP